jgi:ATP-dependent Zn protease
MRPLSKSIALCLVLAGIGFASTPGLAAEPPTELSFPELLAKVKEHKVARLEIKGNQYLGTYSGSGERFEATGPIPDKTLTQSFLNEGVDVTFVAPDEPSIWKPVLVQWLPFVIPPLLLAAMVIFFIGRHRSKRLRSQ